MLNDLETLPSLSLSVDTVTVISAVPADLADSVKPSTPTTSALLVFTSQTVFSDVNVSGATVYSIVRSASPTIQIAVNADSFVMVTLSSLTVSSCLSPQAASKPTVKQTITESIATINPLNLLIILSSCQNCFINYPFIGMSRFFISRIKTFR